MLFCLLLKEKLGKDNNVIAHIYFKIAHLRIYIVYYNSVKNKYIYIL